ncbi:MAG TPA: hypothetical protein VFN93_06070 [Gaiellaceae bacterium]|nr:hypothetical protein [Gaiellaceae bacterium]
MRDTCSGADAMAVEVAGALLLATAVSDALGLAAVSFYLLVLGVPLTAIAGLVLFARVVDTVNGAGADALGRLQTALASLLVVTVVLGAAARAPAVAEDTVPPAATAALALAFAILVVQALLALVPVRRQRA